MGMRPFSVWVKSWEFCLFTLFFVCLFFYVESHSVVQANHEQTAEPRLDSNHVLSSSLSPQVLGL